MRRGGEGTLSVISHIFLDNGKEFCGRAMLTWAHTRGVTLRLIEPGKPNQNAYVESFNGRFRGLSHPLLKFSGGSVDDYATIPDDSSSPS